METLTKTPEQMSESFAQPDMQERFEAWAERTAKEARQEKKEEKSGPREINLKGRSEKEQEFIKSVGTKDESKDSANESRREGSAEKEPTAHGEQRPKATESGKADGEKLASESTKAPVEPMATDRYWESSIPGKAMDAKELEKHWQSVNGRARVALEYINSHPQKDQIAQGLKAFFAGKPKAWQNAVSPDFFTALAEVASPGEVLRHIALQAEDREVLRKAKNWQELRANIQTIAKLYPRATSQASPKPRAPKPPSEVGGRGAATDDSTRNAENFSSFSESMNRRYAQR